MKNEDLVLCYQRTTDEAIRRKMLETLYLQNEPIIRKICSPYARNDDLEDLQQEAFFGIVEAADRWSPDAGAKFITYASVWVKLFCWKYLNQGGRSVRLPQHMGEKVTQYQAFLKEYEVRTGAEPTDQEIIVELDLTKKQLAKIRNALNMLQPRSTAETIPGADDLALGDTIPDPADLEDSIINEIQQERLSETVSKVMNEELNDQERAVIWKLYRDCNTLAETGSDLGLTISQVRTIESKSLRKMRKRKQDLEAFLESKAVDFSFHSGQLTTFKRTHTSCVEMAILATEEKYECI